MVQAEYFFFIEILTSVLTIQSSISQFEFLFEQLFTIKLFQCFHIQMVVVPFLRNNPLFFPKHYGKNIRSASGFFIAGNSFIENPGFPFLHFRLI
jgi:hypothetical protein